MGVYRVFDDGIGRRGISATDYQNNVTQGTYAKDWHKVRPAPQSAFFNKLLTETGELKPDIDLSKMPKARTAAEAQQLVKILAMHADRALSMILTCAGDGNASETPRGRARLKKIFDIAKHFGVSRSLTTLLNQEIDRSHGDGEKAIMSASIRFAIGQTSRGGGKPAPQTYGSHDPYDPYSGRPRPRDPKPQDDSKPQGK